MSRVMVTGGAGFIGREVARELARRNYKARVFDLVETDIKEADCSYTGSILDPYELSRAMRGCDYVIHLAAALGVQRTENNRLECLFINIQGTVNVLEACIKEKIKKIIFVSSSEVYGEQKIQPITEDAPLNPKSNYAISKIVGEEYARAYFETYGLKYNIVRLFNVYGEDQREDFVMIRFIKNILKNNAPLIYGKGEQIRSFCYVEDATRGIVDALFRPLSQQIFNIGNDAEPITIKELAYKVIEISNKSLRPKFVSYKNSDRDSDRDIIKRTPSIDKAKKILNYKPQVYLGDGIRRIIKYYEERAV